MVANRGGRPAQHPCKPKMLLPAPAAETLVRELLRCLAYACSRPTDCDFDDVKIDTWMTLVVPLTLTLRMRGVV